MNGESKVSRSVNNSGTIRLRPDGRWEARVTVGINPVNGKPIRKSIYGSSQGEVRKAMTKVQASIDTGTFVSSQKVTVAEWFEEWLNTFCSMNLKQYSLSSYKGIVKNHINPNMGNMKLQAVKGIHVQRLYNNLLANGASPKTIKNIGAVMHKAFSIAIKQGLISVNPCEAAELPRCQRHEIKPFTDSEIPVFLRTIKGHPMENAYAFSLLSGMREGECLGLSWRQVDFKNQKIVVDQQLQRCKEKGGSYFIVPFTKSNKPRTIKLPPIAFEYLKREQNIQKAHKLAAGSEWANADDLVFTNKMGGHYDITYFYKCFKALVEKMGRPDMRLHDLRHTAATVAIASGADVKSVQNLLGHATASFTLNVYAHTSEKMMEDTAARIQNYYQTLG